MGESLWMKFISYQQEKIPDFPREAILMGGIEGLLGGFEEWLRMTGHIKEDGSL